MVLTLSETLATMETMDDNLNNMTSEEEYFGLPQELTPERYIALAEEVLEVTSLLFAPFGVARAFDRGAENDSSSSMGDAKVLTEEFQDIHQRTMDSVAEAVYRRHGLSEGTVALSCHKLLEGPSRDEQCVAVTSKSQQSLSKLVNPPHILEIENSICDPTFDEINDIALKVKEATSLLQSSSSSSSSSLSSTNTNELPMTGCDSSSSPSSTNSLGWAGTYIGTVISLGFNLNIETPPPSAANASGIEVIVGYETPSVSRGHFVGSKD
jgi:hypothetical protein